MAVVALTAYAVLPGVLGVGLRRAVRTDARRATAGTVALAVLRLALQALDGGARFAVGLVTLALALAVLTDAVRLAAARPQGGRAAGRAVAVGAAGGVGLQLLLGTWDAVWRDGAVGWGVAVLLVAALVALARATGRAVADGAGRADGAARPGRTWTLGPALALLAMTLANPAFSASQTGLPLAVAGPVTAAGLLLAAALGTTGRPEPGAGGLATLAALQPWLDVVLLVGLTVVVVLPVVDVGGPATLVALVAVQVLAVASLAAALEPRPGTVRRRRAAGLVSCVVGLGTILPLLVYQVDYDVPLGVHNGLVLVATAAVLGVAGLRRVEPASRVVATASGARLVRAPAAGPGAPSSPRRSASSSWGRRSPSRGTCARRRSPPRPPAARARASSCPGTSTTRCRRPARSGSRRSHGRSRAPAPTSCSSRRCRAAGSWARARTPRRGWRSASACGSRSRPPRTGSSGTPSSRGPLRDVEVVPLPYGAGPQKRSALRAVVPLGGTEVAVTSVHLQHRESNTPTRLEQVAVLLEHLGDEAVVLGGDLNAEPGWPEVTALLEAGFTSAQDAVGDPAALTSPSTEPRHRIDWLLVRGYEVRTHEVLPVTASDHRPLVARVAVD